MPDAFSIENPFFIRTMKEQAGGLFTTDYRDKAHGDEQLIELPGEREGSIALNGSEFVFGGTLERSLPIDDVLLAGMKDGGQQLTIRLRPVGELPKGIAVSLVYEASSSAPVLKKWVHIANDSDAPVRLHSITVESVTPRVTPQSALMLEDDYVRDAMTVGGRRAYSPWIEEHHKYIDAILSINSEPTRFAYPVEMDYTIDPGGVFCSFKVYEFAVTNANRELRGLEFRKATRMLFPWTRRRFLACMLAPANDVEVYRRGISAAADAGYEGVVLGHGWIDGKLTHPIFTNYNDYVPRPKLFPDEWRDIRRLTDYAHERGLQIGCYTIYVNTWRSKDEAPRVHRENDWELVWAPDDDSSRWGHTLDPASGWGAFVNRRLEELMTRGGFDTWHLDGPYYGDICVAKNRAYKPGGPSQVKAWERQTAFYSRMSRLGLHGEAAQGFSAFAHGMSRITTTGYIEGDFGRLPIPEQILANRAAAYRFTHIYRPEQATTNVPVVPWSPDRDGPGLIPMEKHAAEYDAYLANMFGYGFEGKVYQRVPWEGPKSRAAVQRWLGFWKEHEAFFKKGYLAHVRPPDGMGIDAVMHILHDEDRLSALVVAYNPTQGELVDALRLPFDLLEWPTQGWMAVSESGGRQRLDGCVLSVRVPAFNATWYNIDRYSGVFNGEQGEN